jgi:hypothetical protein
MICKFICTKCHVSFYWTPRRESSLCVQCPECHEEYRPCYGTYGGVNERV